MTVWELNRDAIYRSLHRHAVECLLCRSCTPGVHVHNACEDGIVLLTDWFIAKKEAEREQGRAVTSHQVRP